MAREVQIVPLNGSHDRKSFDCGVGPLNEFLQKQASQGEKKGTSRTFVAQPIGAGFNVQGGYSAWSQNAILGYYVLSASQVMQAATGEELPRSYPLNVPAIRLGRLAVDVRAKGQGLGQILLMNAMYRAYEVSLSVGSSLIWVDAKDEQAAKFYEKYDFIRAERNKLGLYMPMKTIGLLVERSQARASSGSGMRD